MNNCVSALHVLFLGAFVSNACAENVKPMTVDAPSLEIKVISDKTGNAPAGSLTLETVNHLPADGSPVAAHVMIKSASDTLAQPVTVGSFMLLGDEQPLQGYTFDVKNHVNKQMLSDLEKGNAIVTVTVKPETSPEIKNVIELKSATFEK